MVKEVVVPLLVVDTAVLICISTLKEADNSYSKMFEAIKPDGSKMFEQVNSYIENIQITISNTYYCVLFRCKSTLCGFVFIKGSNPSHASCDF